MGGAGEEGEVRGDLKLGEHGDSDWQQVYDSSRFVPFRVRRMT
jgi:hypothetical protein